MTSWRSFEALSGLLVINIQLSRTIHPFDNVAKWVESEILWDRGDVGEGTKYIFVHDVKA